MHTHTYIYIYRYLRQNRVPPPPHTHPGPLISLSYPNPSTLSTTTLADGAAAAACLPAATSHTTLCTWTCMCCQAGYHTTHGARCCCLTSTTCGAGLARAGPGSNHRTAMPTLLSWAVPAHNGQTKTLARQRFAWVTTIRQVELRRGTMTITPSTTTMPAVTMTTTTEGTLRRQLYTCHAYTNQTIQWNQHAIFYAESIFYKNVN